LGEIPTGKAAKIGDRGWFWGGKKNKTLRVFENENGESLSGGKGSEEKKPDLNQTGGEFGKSRN